MVTDAPRPTEVADEDLFRRLYPALRRFAAVVGRLDVDPDDLVQEAVLKTLRRGPLHRLEAPGAYLRRAILSVATDSRRTSSRTAEVISLLAREQEEPVPDAAGALDVLDVLSPLDRALLYLVDVERFTLKEAAPMLGLSHTAARSRASRARLRARDHLRPTQGEVQ